ncbi:hypothetical protein MANI_027426 [Metarhizium anisopliae]|nr:hypothetical protein MANI_027426 [Metarhizium anisopliae]
MVRFKILRSSALKDKTSSATAVSSALPSSSQQPQQPQQPQQSFGTKTLHENENSTIDILFVHGLRGHRENTWKAKDASEPWPQALLPVEIPNARILTFGYDAAVTDVGSMVSQSTIAGHSGNLLSALATHRRKNATDRPIIFVCHSLGGLVCQDALSYANQSDEPHLKQVLHCTCGMIFLGTPHHGSALATWAKALAEAFKILHQTNSDILAVLKKDSEVLARVQSAFHILMRLRKDPSELGPKINITCFYEELAVLGVGQVVPKDSAIIPGYTSIGIHGNHMDMTKFEDSNDAGFVAVAGELSRWCEEVSLPNAVGTSVTSSREGCNMIPFDRDPKFVGREDVIKEIDRRFERQRHVALCGLGGVGKSQIAIEYAYRFQQKHPDAHVFWVYSSSGSRMYQGYLQIAEKLNLSGQIGREVNVFRLVCEALGDSICGQWLLVLDNLDDMKVLESTAEIPCQNCLVGNWMTNNEITRIEPPDESDAVLLFRSYLVSGNMSDFNDYLELNCLKLVKALEYMPLAITQAAAYIRNNGVSLDEYLKILHKSDEELSSLMDEEEKDSRRDFQSNCSIFRTWKISFDMIRRSWPRAADILCLMAVLDRQGVPERLLKCQTELEAEFKRSLGRLKAFSLISATKVEGDLGMHRLVQLAVREWITRDQEIYKYQEEALEVMAREFPTVTYENWTWCQALLPHVLVVIRYKTSDEMIIPRARLLQIWAYTG